MTHSQYSLEDLLRVMQRLRDPEKGCPWDMAQTFESIVPSTLEECYELAAAIESQDYAHVEDELGDVLFQVVFYSQMGREEGLFDFSSVVNVLVEKLLRRHPHVFSSGEIAEIAGISDQAEGSAKLPVEAETLSLASVSQSWEAIKQYEREGKNQQSLMDDLPIALPALPRAQKLQKRAARVGFDWSALREVMLKVSEELVELSEAIDARDEKGIEDELGDLLFSCVNLARHAGLDAESSLRKATAKFERRFRAMEALAKNRGVTLSSLDAEAMDGLWRDVKQQD